MKIEDIWNRLNATGTALCREANGGEELSFCNFRLRIDSRSVNLSNAELIIGADGRPEVHLGRRLTLDRHTANEIAFVISHEMSHRIANHSIGQLTFNTIAMEDGPDHFSLSPVDPHFVELEADAIGTIVAATAGFDPLLGARILYSFTAPQGEPSHTHPAMARRLELVSLTLTHLAAGDELVWN